MTTQFTSPWKFPLKYLKVCRWAALHDPLFQNRHFFLPGRVHYVRHNSFSGVYQIAFELAILQDPFPHEVHADSNVWTEDELKRFFFNDIPF